MNNGSSNNFYIAFFILALCAMAVLNPFISLYAAEDHRPEAETHKKSVENHGRHDAESHEQEMVVHISDEQIELLKIRVEKTNAGSADSIVESPASILFNADHIARIGPLIESRVVSVTKGLGDEVEAGDVLAILDSVELGRVKARYLVAVARYQSALAEYQRDKTLAEKQITSEAELIKSRAYYLETKAERNAVREELRLYGMSPKQIDRISAGGDQPLSRYSLFSPVDGIVQRRELVTGQTLTSSDTPVHIVNTDEMWVMVDAYEKALPHLATGQFVTLTLRSLPGRTYQGRIDWISRELDAQTRTVRVRAVVPNDDGLLRAGMFGTANIQTNVSGEFALVPVDAVQSIGNEKFVFVPGGEPGAFRAMPVLLGNEAGGKIEIRKGLEPGDNVVVQGAFKLNAALTAGSRSAEHSH